MGKPNKRSRQRSLNPRSLTPYQQTLVRQGQQGMLRQSVREGAAEPELPRRFASWGQPDMWERNVAALRDV